MYLGILRVTTIFLFGAACFIVAPSCWADDSQQWLAPLGEFAVLSSVRIGS